MPPFTISIEPIEGIYTTGVHSNAFAQFQDKWLIVGGRINGLHGLNSNDGFPPEFANNQIIVIDTVNWQEYTATLDVLPFAIADPLRTTNMQYIHDGEYLYLIGGFGWDNVAGIFVTFPKLTAIHVENMINTVITGGDITPHIRQITDTTFQVCGGELGKLGNEMYLMFGHNFGGRYTDPPSPLFTQQYLERITRFTLNDDGANLSISNVSLDIDTNYYHRRDLTVGPSVKPDGTFALNAYSGVFRKTINLPFREVLSVGSSGVDINTTYDQVMSHYTCANIPVFDSLSNKFYSTFLGGISMFDYLPASNTVVLDSLVPFISDITTMTIHPGGSIEETVLPVQLPARLGSNAKFVLSKNIAHYSNEVIKIRQLANERILAGYMHGGIRSDAGNLGSTVANDTIYRIFITPNNQPLELNENEQITHILVHPNPSNGWVKINFNLNMEDEVSVEIYDLHNKLVKFEEPIHLGPGNRELITSTEGLSSGIYNLKITTSLAQYAIKLLVVE